MRGREGWNRLRGGCGGTWLHESGCEFNHCGHPTANWPYYGVTPDGRMVTSHNGRGFKRLAEAQAAMEQFARECLIYEAEVNA